MTSLPTSVLVIAFAAIALTIVLVLRELIGLLRRGDSIEAYLPDDVKALQSPGRKRFERFRILCLVVAFGSILLVGVAGLLDARVELVLTFLVLGGLAMGAYLLGSMIGGFAEGWLGARDLLRQIRRRYERGDGPRGPAA